MSQSKNRAKSTEKRKILKEFAYNLIPEIP